MNHSYTGTFGRIRLCPLTEETSEILRQMRNKPQIRKWFNNASVITKEEQESWFKKYLLDDTEIMYVAYLLKDSSYPVGFLGYYNLNRMQRTVEAGRRIVDSENTTERGLGAELTCCGLAIAFEYLPIDYVYAEVFADNQRSLNSAEKAGYFKIGSVSKNGRELIKLQCTLESYRKALEVM